MYVGKRIKSILSVLLICGLLVVSVPSRAIAAGPLLLVPALSPAMKYAIGAGLVAGGLYAVDKEALNYAINDYWTKASDYVKHQWQSAVIYGTNIGNILLNDPLKSSMKSYLDSTYSPGENVVTLPPTETFDAAIGVIYDLAGFSIMGQGMSLGPDVVRYKPPGYATWVWTKDILVGDTVIYTIMLYGDDADKTFLNWAKVEITGTGVNALIKFHLSYNMVNNEDYRSTSSMKLSVLAERLGVSVAELFYEYGETVSYNLTGDTAGFGNATEGRPDIKVPCPPVPAAEWPDTWLDNLQDEMNRTGNPTLDDETSIEEWEDEYEWYLDEFGNIYKVKKGQKPKKPEDEPLRIPGPPFPAPDVPKNYPTEDDPDLTVEHHPPQTTVTENPDGSRTETTTQTTTTTKKWWDPSSQRWRTTTTDTTTTTTVDFAPDGTETGRTTTTTTQPKGEREETAQPDDTAIDWEPLRRGLFELTEKFPFCLPWDLMRGIQSLESSQWDRKIRIEVGDGIWPAMVIDLTMFDRIASITRVILLIVFDLGLIFGTRKLMGGDV